MRAPLMRIRLAFVAPLALLAACALNGHPSTGIERLPGALDSLQPRIFSATDVGSGGLTLRLTVPQRSYVTVIRLFTQANISIMAPSPGTSTALAALDSGPHTLALVPATAYLQANGKRVGRVQNARDGALVATDSRYPIHEYTVVVATTRPLTLADQQESLGDLDLVGPDEVVVRHVAEAIGTHSPGAWAASVTRPTAALSPF